MSAWEPSLEEYADLWEVDGGKYVIADVSSLKTSLTARCDISGMFGAFETGDVVRLTHRVRQTWMDPSGEKARVSHSFDVEKLDRETGGYSMLFRNMPKQAAMSVFWCGDVPPTAFFAPLYQVVPIDSPHAAPLMAGVPHDDVFAGEGKVVR